MQRLGQVATGEQMGAGEMALRRQGAVAQANQAGAAMGARGLGANAVAANAARNAAAMGTEIAGRAGEAALGDQAAANQLLGQVAGQNVGQSLQARGMDDAQAMAALDALYRMDLAEQQGRLGLEGYRQAAAAGQVGTGTQIANMGANLLPILAQGRSAPQGTVPFRSVPASTYTAPRLGVMS